MKITIITSNPEGEKTALHYSDAETIDAGTALDILGERDAVGNGLKLTTPLIQVHFTDGGTATFNARHTKIILCK